MRLLHRTNRSVTVTPEGATYHERVVRLLVERADIESSTRLSRGSTVGRVHAEVPVAIGAMILVPALADFYRQYPDVNLQLGVSNRRTDAVAEGVDCVIWTNSYVAAVAPQRTRQIAGAAPVFRRMRIGLLTRTVGSSKEHSLPRGDAMRFPEYPASEYSRHRPRIEFPAAQRSREFDFAQMRSAYTRSGGLVAGDEFACRLGERLPQPVSIVARWIVSHQVVSFVWHSQILLPLFQFDDVDLTPRPDVTAAVQELGGTLDDWELALWFVRPNHLLGEQSPVDALAADPASVLSAARAERYFMRG